MPKIASRKQYKVLYWQCEQSLVEVLTQIQHEREEQEGTHVPLGRVLNQLIRSHPAITARVPARP